MENFLGRGINIWRWEINIKQPENKNKCLDSGLCVGDEMLGHMESRKPSVQKRDSSS